MLTKPEPPSYHERLIAWWIVVLALAIFSGIIICGVVSDALGAEIVIPSAAQRYRNDLTRNARLAWGLDAPIATFAAQIHAESAWKSDAKSNVGASGVAQFMSPTAEWLSGLYPDLDPPAPTNPVWAMRALTQYDKYLYDRAKGADHCQTMAFALSAYNGGERFLLREAATCKASCQSVAPVGAVPSGKSSKPAHPKLGSADGTSDLYLGSVAPGGIGHFSPRLGGMMLAVHPVLFPGAVLTPVSAVLQNREVLRSEIHPIAVNVVNVETVAKRSALREFYDKAVHELALALHMDSRIAVPVDTNDLPIGDAKTAKQGGKVGGKVGEDHAPIVKHPKCVCDELRYFDNVENSAAGRAPQYFSENRTYVRRILKSYEPAYVKANWGSASCSA